MSFREKLECLEEAEEVSLRFAIDRNRAIQEERLLPDDDKESTVEPGV